MDANETLDRLVQCIYEFKHEVLAENHFKHDVPSEKDLRQFYRDVLEIVDECDDVAQCIHCDRDLIKGSNYSWNEDDDAWICDSCLEAFHDKLERDD